MAIANHVADGQICSTSASSHTSLDVPRGKAGARRGDPESIPHRSTPTGSELSARVRSPSARALAIRVEGLLLDIAPRLDAIIQPEDVERVLASFPIAREARARRARDASGSRDFNAPRARSARLEDLEPVGGEALHHLFVGRARVVAGDEVVGGGSGAPAALGGAR